MSRTKPGGGDGRVPAVARIATGLAVAAGTLWIGEGAACAQADVGAAGQFAITAEDLTGYFAERQVYKDEQGLERTDDTGHLSLLFRTGGVKLGAHYFLIPSLSIGATLGYESRSGSVAGEDPPGTFTMDKGTEWTLAFQPKVGYLLMVGKVVGFWFRGGPGVMHYSNHPNVFQKEDEVRATYWLFGLDALVAIIPLPNVGLFLGPTADLSFAGSHGETIVPDAGPRVDYDKSASYRRLGGTLGAMAYF
jgi:hypothetical protein